jgi:hypothetical protein
VQKALTEMNIQLANVTSDLIGWIGQRTSAHLGGFGMARRRVRTRPPR